MPLADPLRLFPQTLLLALSLLLVSLAEDVRAESPLSFNRDIRPILSEHCYACHGPDAETRYGELRLDDRNDAVRDRDGYHVIEAGNADESELIARVSSADPDIAMPPADHAEPLSTEQIETLRRWINEGASYEVHWSFAPLQAVSPPDVEDREHPIDAFIAARLQEEGYAFSPQADPRVLIRRLSFDLTGLPPELSDVQTFAENPSDEAYQAFTRKYLSSPHYGERMAIYWLDLVRYADSLGFHGDQERSVSPYRDYVIRAFNDNKPFDEFTIEQLAGDLLAEPTLESRVASTYNRLNRASGEGGVQPKEYLAKYAADRVRTLGTVWLGTTVGCAECHDHKFDPYTIKDFYSFAAFFADIKEQGIVSGARYIEQLPVPTPEQSEQKQKLTTRIAAAEKNYRKARPDLQAGFEEWLATAKDAQPQWTPVVPSQATSTGGATLSVDDEGNVLASGKSPDNDTYRIVLPLNQASASVIRAIQLEVLPDPSLPSNGPGRAGNGNLVLQAVKATVGGKPVQWSRAMATHAQDGFPAENLLKGNRGWALLPETGKRQALTLIPQQPIVAPDDDSSEELVLELVQNHGTSHCIGRFRVLATSNDLTDGLAFPDADVVKLLADPSEGKQAQLLEYYRTHTPLLRKERNELAQLRRELETLEKAILTTLAVTATEPREMRVLPRGDWMDDSGAVVTPSVPEFLPAISVQGNRADRLDLAQWLASAENPLVARTFVNRVWMLFFGQGLSRSVDDLGAQGEMPSHPELLDWLSVEFIRSGWDVKRLVELIVTSETYRQASSVSPELRRNDPFNRLYARQSRWRLDAEMVRDNALSVSDLLVETVAGPSVKPYQPAGYWAQLNFPKREYQHSDGSSQYRRGLYTHWQRTFLHPSLLAFDAPPREECTARRERSNTPLQALVLLNDPTYVEAARALAENILQQGGDSFESRLEWAWNRVLARTPTELELTTLRTQWEKSQRYYEQNPDQAAQVVNVGLSPVSKNLPAADVASWMTVTRTLLNLHETISRY
ncbi:PSD1 and planctomycete cytochrome C domain-containing protein [Rubinisphaera margarita]|uniref:PSD1 and planctomycete cytochrome C domain-containing protein n=1 Tax=Rubinisphaera margarita TaxID=2909586 RepID=UPI001EE8EDB0|nr:PSD1 and planctomycete cytochrome C domain-containing protein [Rubinisphaera margarita]MCG6157978.1 PSD1 and planctomycete cytochrome C domain-containing protein [Rubinisphaera margarita]